jgi:hypothetical protein
MGVQKMLRLTKKLVSYLRKRFNATFKVRGLVKGTNFLKASNIQIIGVRPSWHLSHDSNISS